MALHMLSCRVSQHVCKVLINDSRGAGFKLTLTFQGREVSPLGEPMKYAGAHDRCSGFRWFRWSGSDFRDGGCDRSKYWLAILIGVSK